MSTQNLFDERGTKSENLPSMTNANDRFYIAQTTFQHLVPPNLCHITQSKQTMIREDCSNPHSSSMHDRFQP